MKEKINSIINKLYDHFYDHFRNPEVRGLTIIMITYMITTLIIFSCMYIANPEMFLNDKNGWEIESSKHITIEYIEEESVPFEHEEETTIEVNSRITDMSEMTTEEYIEESVIESTTETTIIPETTTEEEYIEEESVPFEQEEETTIEVYDYYYGDVIISEDIDIEYLQSTIDIIAPGLSGIEEAVLDIYNTTGLDPFFQIAIFCLESGYGTSDLAIYKNNIAGWNAYPTGNLSAYENATHFDSIADCASTVGYNLYTNYVQQGYTTIDSISMKYCPPNSVSWSSSVESIKNRLKDTYYSLT